MPAPRLRFPELADRLPAGISSLPATVHAPDPYTSRLQANMRLLSQRLAQLDQQARQLAAENEALRHELDLNARGAVGQARIEAEQIVAAAEERAAAIDAMTKVRVERRLEEQREALAKQAADLEVVTRARIAELKEAAAEMGGDTTDGGASEGVDRTDAEREEHP
ncbi:MAG: hypothetical protein R2700_16455 [Solirubrobacterales bacterium]